MTWLDTLLSRGSEAKREVTVSRSTVAPVARPKPVEIRHVTVQTAAPFGDHPGAITVGYYSVQDGVVVMHNEDGKPTGKRMAAGDDPRRVAYLITREAWKAEAPDFNRPLHYPPLSIA